MKWINFTFLFLLAANVCFAQHTITNYTTEDGLLHNSVNSVWVDADDNIWFGTQEGVSRFNGLDEWNSYTEADGLHTNNTKAVCFDSFGNLWAGSDFGLSKFDGETWTYFDEDNGLLDNRVTYINQAPDGMVWVGTKGGISVLDPLDQVQGFLIITPFGGVTHVAFGEKPHISTALDGVIIFDPSGIDNLLESNGLLSNLVRAVAIDEEGQKWIATADGISLYNASNEFVQHHEYIFELPPPDKLNPVEDIKVDSEGTIWAGVYVDYLVTEGGVSFYDGVEWKDYDVDDGLVGPVVRRLDIDSEDNVWVATSTGVSKIEALPTSSNQAWENASISLLPNPASDQIILNVPEALMYKDFKLFNAQGQLLHTGSINADKQIVDIANLQSGIYVIVVDALYSGTFIKQ